MPQSRSSSMPSWLNGVGPQTQANVEYFGEFLSVKGLITSSVIRPVEPDQSAFGSERMCSSCTRSSRFTISSSLARHQISASDLLKNNMVIVSLKTNEINKYVENSILKLFLSYNLLAFRCKR